MNKAGIVDALHAILGGTKVQAEQAVDTVINSIIDSLKKGDEVSIAGLGIFSVKERAARDARNPRTGETIKVPAMKVPKFRAAKALKTRSNSALSTGSPFSRTSEGLRGSGAGNQAVAESQLGATVTGTSFQSKNIVPGGKDLKSKSMFKIIFGGGEIDIFV